MRGPVLRKLFNVGLWIFILAHIFMLTVYVLPHKPASNAIVGISDLYMSRLFHQEWDLFAPEPPTESLKLEYILFDDQGAPVDTIYPADQALQKHLSFTSVTATKEVYLNRRYAQYLLEDGADKEIKVGDPSLLPWPLIVADSYLGPYVLQDHETNEIRYMPVVTINDSLVLKTSINSIIRSE